MPEKSCKNGSRLFRNTPLFQPQPRQTRRVVLPSTTMQGALGTYLNIRCKGTARTTLCSARKRQNRRKFTVTFARAASSSWSNTNPYPFPTSSNPSPYQVFHLLPGASAAEIKQRCKHMPMHLGRNLPDVCPDYELVKLYHPDAVEPQRSPGQEDATARHARFQAITAAYDKLQMAADPALFLEEERKQQDAARAARRRREVDLPNGFDERWKDRLIWGGLMLVSDPSFNQVA